MKALVAVQPDFEIYVNCFGVAGKIGVKDVIRRRDWYGTADVNVVEDNLVADGTVSIAVLEFTRYQLHYTNSWSTTRSERRDIRVLAKDIDTAIAMTLGWIAAHPEYTMNQHSATEIEAYHNQQHALEMEAWRTKHAQL